MTIGVCLSTKHVGRCVSRKRSKRRKTCRRGGWCDDEDVVDDDDDDDDVDDDGYVSTMVVTMKTSENRIDSISQSISTRPLLVWISAWKKDLTFWLEWSMWRQGMMIYYSIYVICTVYTDILTPGVLWIMSNLGNVFLVIAKFSSAWLGCPWPRQSREDTSTEAGSQSPCSQSEEERLEKMTWLSNKHQDADGLNT